MHLHIARTRIAQRHRYEQGLSKRQQREKILSKFLRSELIAYIEKRDAELKREMDDYATKFKPKKPW